MDESLVLNYMKQALDMAADAKGTTSPNPTVGAIIIKDGKVIGKGVTQKHGKDHAEIQALKSCTENPKDSTLIVTLEPCSFYGKTPPCVDAIKHAGIKEVYMATLDPNEKVNGKGLRILKEAGIHVEHSFLKDEASTINEDFFKWIRTGIPYITIKYAMTLDGKMATSSYSSKWISGEESREDVHKLRFINDAILVGSNTVHFDNPTLNSRLTDKTKYPLRVVVDADCKLTREHTVIKDDHPTLIAIQNNDEMINYYREEVKGKANKTILPLQYDEKGINLLELFKHLGKINITSVLVEGGSHILYSSHKNNLIDKVVVYVAPKIISGDDGIVPFAGVGLKDMFSATTLHNVEYKRFGSDIRVVGYPN